jgi:hypothetical protein
MLPAQCSLYGAFKCAIRVFYSINNNALSLNGAEVIAVRVRRPVVVCMTKPKYHRTFSLKTQDVLLDSYFLGLINEIIFVDLSEFTDLPDTPAAS